MPAELGGGNIIVAIAGIEDVFREAEGAINIGEIGGIVFVAIGFKEGEGNLPSLWLMNSGNSLAIAIVPISLYWLSPKDAILTVNPHLLRVLHQEIEVFSKFANRLLVFLLIDVINDGIQGVAINTPGVYVSRLLEGVSFPDDAVETAEGGDGEIGEAELLGEPAEIVVEGSGRQ
jgi:hypothetical protein